MWNYETVNSGTEYLAHYGILGMKWGVRRYQNEDGTLTAAGKKRYGNAEAEFAKYNEAKNDYKDAVKYFNRMTAGGMFYNKKASDRLNKSAKRLDYANDDLKDARTKVLLSEQKKKSSRQLHLEEAYRKKGLTKEEAEIAAYKRAQTEKAIAIAAGVTVAAATTYVAYKHYDKVADRLIKPDTLLQNISSNSNRGVSDAFYASLGRHDNNRYAGLLGKTLSREVDSGLATGVYNTKIKIGSSGLKVASPKNAAAVLKKTMESDSDFRDMVSREISGWQSGMLIGPQKKVFDKAAKSLNAGKVDEHVYDAVNIALVDHGGNGQALANKFYAALKDAGYDAIRDVNDSKYSGYNTLNPVIVFNGAAKSAIDSVTKMDKAKIDKQYAREFYKLAAETAIKTNAPQGAALVGGILAGTTIRNSVKEKSDLAYIRKYRKEHPESELSAKEILRNR